MKTKLHSELLRLLSALCDDQLTDVEHARLDELLCADTEARRTYLAYLDMHARMLMHPRMCPVQPDQPEIHAAHAQDRRERRRPQMLRYAVVVLASLAASILVQLLWWHPETQEHERDASKLRGARPQTATFVATLTQSADCIWEGAKQSQAVGPRLPTGELQLKKGVARIRFDSGPDLVVEGPATLRVDSGTAATVLQGKVVVRGDETAVGFDLHTPCSTLVDLGAEYAVEVGPDGEEVHVFDGAVQRSPKAADGPAPERLTAGEARSYGPSPQAPGRPAECDPTRFVRQLSGSLLVAPDGPEGLLVYEGFDYAHADILRSGKADGGFGWTSPWTPGFARPTLEGDKNYAALNAKESLVRPGNAAPSIGGSFDYCGFAKYQRRMAVPVRLDSDQVYYLSFLFRREGPPADDLNAVAILFRTSAEVQRGKDDARKRLNVGVGGWNQLFTHLNGVG
jgi:hypothetical protein